MRTLKHLAVAAAMVGLVAPVQAEYYPGSTDFEGDSPLADACWSNVVEAAIEADASVADVPRSPNLPPSFDNASRTNVLSLDTDAQIVRYLQSDRAAPSASTIYIDVLTKGDPLLADASVPDVGDDDKIFVYSRVSQSGSETNLCVYAKDAADGTAQEFVLTKTIGKDEWHRLVVKATAAGYQVYCDGTDAAATDKLYECYLLNCSIKAQNPGGALSNTAIAVTNGLVSITVRLDRQKPLGFINGVLHIYGTDDLAVGFGKSPISEEIVNFVDGDSIFDIEQAEGPVTQSVTAIFSLTDVTAKFFSAVIEFPIAGDPWEDPREEPWEEPEE